MFVCEHRYFFKSYNLEKILSLSGFTIVCIQTQCGLYTRALARIQTCQTFVYKPQNCLYTNKRLFVYEHLLFVYEHPPIFSKLGNLKCKDPRSFVHWQMRVCIRVNMHVYKHDPCLYTNFVNVCIRTDINYVCKYNFLYTNTHKTFQQYIMFIFVGVSKYITNVCVRE